MSLCLQNFLLSKNRAVLYATDAKIEGVSPASPFFGLVFRVRATMSREVPLLLRALTNFQLVRERLVVDDVDGPFGRQHLLHGVGVDHPAGRGGLVRVRRVRLLARSRVRVVQIDQDACKPYPESSYCFRPLPIWKGWDAPTRREVRYCQRAAALCGGVVRRSQSLARRMEEHLKRGESGGKRGRLQLTPKGNSMPLGRRRMRPPTSWSPRRTSKHRATPGNKSR